MRFDRMMRQGLAIAASISMMAAWPAAPGFAADKNIDLDGSTANGAESNGALSVVTTYPTKIKSKITNKAVGQAFRFSWPGAGPGGFFSSVTAGSTGGVGAIWTWDTTQQVFSINSDITFNQTSPGTVTRTFTGLPGRSLSASGVTTSAASLTSSLITFFSPPSERVRVTSSVTPLAGGLFKYETEITNFTGDPINYDWSGGPLGCDSQVCGNGTHEGSEECDGSDLNGADCEVFGGSGTLGCTEGCTYDLTGCDNVCGNGRAGEKKESCDGSDLNGQTCESVGYAGGTLACAGDCTFDTSGCTPAVCGNGVIEGFEQCDGSNLDGIDCTTLGYASGTLACSDGCSFDTSGCVASVCGNGLTEPEEVCDGSDLADQDCNSQGFECGTLACAGDCQSFDTSNCTNLCFQGGGLQSGPPTASAPRSTRTLSLGAAAPSRSPRLMQTPRTASSSTTASTSRAARRAAVSHAIGASPQVASRRTLAAPLGEGPCDFPGASGRVDGNASVKTCSVNVHPAKEVTSKIVVCGNGLPSGPQGCGTSTDSGTQGTANVLVPDGSVDVGEIFLSPFHVAVQDGQNGFAEPGETFNVLVALVNTGPHDLTNVTATLSAIPEDLDGDGTPDAPTITQATSAYPTIPGIPGGVADCDSPAAALHPVFNLTPFVVTLPPGFPSDTNIKFALSVTGTSSSCAAAFCLGAFGQNVPFVMSVGSACSLSNLDGAYTRVDGFLSPMGPLVPAGDPFTSTSDASSSRTRPLKLRIFCGSRNLTDADVAAPQIVALTRDGVPQDVTKVDLNDNANNNSLLFRFSSGFWIYNMRSKLLGHGTFVITIRFANGQEYQSQFVL